MLSSSLFIPIFLLLNFNNFPIWLQISLLILFCSGVVWGSWRKRMQYPKASYTGYGLAAGMVLCAGAWLINELGASLGIQMIYVSCYGIALCWIGIRCKLSWLHLSGWLLLLTGYSSLLITWHGAFRMMEWELAWLPSSILFAWLGWLFQHRHQAVGTVFLVVAVLAWLASPVVGLLLMPLAMGQIQWLLLVKLVLGALMLYTLRNKWTEWVV